MTLPIHLTPRTVGTMIDKKKHMCRLVVMEVMGEDAQEWRELLQQISPTCVRSDETIDIEYKENLRRDFPLMREWFIVPFSSSKQTPAEMIKFMYRSQQRIWEDKCFNLPVLGIEGNINMEMEVPDGMGCRERFISWTLFQRGPNGDPYLQQIWRANEHQYFFVTLFEGRYDAMAWVDSLNDQVDTIFSEEEQRSIFNSDKACMQRANRCPDKQPSLVDEAYHRMLRAQMGNLQDFPALEGTSQSEKHEPQGGSVWWRRPQLVWDQADVTEEDVTDAEPMELPPPPTLTGFD